MPKRMTALILALLLLVAAMPATIPAALASAQTFSARTPLPDDGDKLNNIRLAAQAIDGIGVPGGDSFSFNEMVGPREKRRGYHKAPNGRGAEVTGGGVAQVASTLYMALLKMGEDVDIDPVKTYGNRFTDDYVQNPSLAIVTDYDAGIDLSFTNLGDDMTIDMWLGDDDLWCVVTLGQQGGLNLLRDKSSGSSLSFLDDGDSYDDDVSNGAGGSAPYAGGSRIGVEGDNEADDWNGSFRPISRDDRNGRTSYRGYEGSASINCGGDRDVLHNVKLAAECLNDTELDSYDVFSFNDVVGPRTKKYGYRNATNGRGSRVTGGGVAQVASALWLAIKDCDDIEILEKSTYGKRYNQHYVSDAADAILTDYASGRDFSFRYTGDASLTVYAYVEDGWLNCEVYER